MKNITPLNVPSILDTNQNLDNLDFSNDNCDKSMDEPILERGMTRLIGFYGMVYHWLKRLYVFSLLGGPNILS